MANKIQVKRSAVNGKVPTTTDLDLGEIGVNTYDGKLYIKKDPGTASIVEIGAPQNLFSSITVSGLAPGSDTINANSTTTNLVLTPGTAVSLSPDDTTKTLTMNITLSGTDKILGRSSSGAGNVEEITCTSAGRALIDDADAAAQRTTLSAQKTITSGTAAPTGGSDGDIYLQYT